MKEYPKVLDQKSRLQMGRQIYAVLEEKLKNKPRSSQLLDIGCSGGIISNYLAGRFGQVVGIDIDTNTLKFAGENFKRPNLIFKKIDARKIDFPDNSYDVVVANQIYMYFGKPQLLFAQIHRVLKPGGLCFLGAVNKYSLTSLRNPKHYYKSWWDLRKLCSGFKITSYTPYIVKKRLGSLFNWVPDRLLLLLEPILPNFIWILEKKS